VSLRINNLATPKQIQALKDLDYCGKWNITTDEAATILTELWEERRMALRNEDYDDDIKYGD
jgi:hypothetical protein